MDMKDGMALNAPICVNDENDAYLKMAKGNTEKIFRVPSRNRTHDLCNAGRRHSYVLFD